MVFTPLKKICKYFSDVSENIFINFHRGICSMIGSVPKKTYLFLLSELESQRQIIRFKTTPNIRVTTSSRCQIVNRMNNAFNALKDANIAGKDISELKSDLSDLITRYYSIQYVPHSEIHVSGGSESGSMQILNLEFRIKRMYFSSDVDIKKKAELFKEVNMFVEKICPERTVFNDYIIIHNNLFLLSDLFRGKKLSSIDPNYPIDILGEYFSASVNLYSFDWKKNISANYSKEQYSKKVLESIGLISEKYILIRPETVAQTVLFARECTENASMPFLDMSLANAKYSGNVIKMFDFTKFETLVLPYYDLVQIALSSPKPAVSYFDIAKLSLAKTNPQNNFEHLWNMGSFYYLIRQMYHSLKDGNDSFGLLEDKLINTDFGDVTAARMLVEDIKNFYSL